VTIDCSKTRQVDNIAEGTVLQHIKNLIEDLFDLVKNNSSTNSLGWTEFGQRNEFGQEDAILDPCRLSGSDCGYSPE
jgi:hypothetical protein